MDWLHFLVRLSYGQGHPVSNQPVAKGLRRVLDQIGLLKHPRGVGAGLSSSCHLLAEGGEKLDLSLLKEAVKVGGVGEGGGVGLDHGGRVLAQPPKVLLSNLLHQNRVITLSRHCCMCQPKESAKSVAGEITLTTAPLPADGHNLLKQPRCDWFDCAAHRHHLFVFRTILVLESPPVFHMVQANIHSNDPCQERHECPLLQLVNQNRSVGLPRWSNSQTSGCIPDGNTDGSLRPTNRHGGDTDSAR